MPEPPELARGGRPAAPSHSGITELVTLPPREPSHPSKETHFLQELLRINFPDTAKQLYEALSSNETMYFTSERSQSFSCLFVWVHFPQGGLSNHQSNFQKIATKKTHSLNVWMNCEEHKHICNLCLNEECYFNLKPLFLDWHFCWSTHGWSSVPTKMGVAFALWSFTCLILDSADHSGCSFCVQRGTIWSWQAFSNPDNFL